jgi:hypothetical protein
MLSVSFVDASAMSALGQKQTMNKHPVWAFKGLLHSDTCRMMVTFCFRQRKSTNSTFSNYKLNYLPGKWRNNHNHWKRDNPCG